jgi:hypothetical protein
MDALLDRYIAVRHPEEWPWSSAAIDIVRCANTKDKEHSQDGCAAWSIDALLLQKKKGGPKAALLTAFSRNGLEA